MQHKFCVFAGSANSGLAASVSRELGVELGRSVVTRFPDGEVSVQILEPVRRREVFIVQPTSPPVNDHLVELLAFADACRRAAAARITAIVPYFGYARMDKRHGFREPITASMVADLIQAVGIDHVVTVDLHAPQIEGFFRIPVDSLTAVPTLCEALRRQLPSHVVVVSPDAGAVRMATDYAQALGSCVVVLHKSRESATETQVTHIVGEVRGCACLIVDDMISTGGTIGESIDALLAAGADSRITVAATHGLLLPGSYEKVFRVGNVKLFLTDTVSVVGKDHPQLRVVSVAPLLAGAIQRFVTEPAQ